jgi:hypothetical protein
MTEERKLNFYLTIFCITILRRASKGPHFAKIFVRFYSIDNGTVVGILFIVIFIKSWILSIPHELIFANPDAYMTLIIIILYINTHIDRKQSCKVGANYNS